jgi:hypothetical protein
VIEELERIVLMIDLPQYGLTIGDLGTVVLVHADGAGYEVEFTDLSGKTLAVVTLNADQCGLLHPAKSRMSGRLAHRHSAQAIHISFAAACLLTTVC